MSSKTKSTSQRTGQQQARNKREKRKDTGGDTASEQRDDAIRRAETHLRRALSHLKQYKKQMGLASAALDDLYQVGLVPSERLAALANLHADIRDTAMDVAYAEQDVDRGILHAEEYALYRPPTRRHRE